MYDNPSLPYIGITERGDAALDGAWIPWVNAGSPAILISKNPVRLLNRIKTQISPECWSSIILHATITGMAGTEYEPNVPKTELSELAKLLEEVPVAKKVLRVDPIIPTEIGLGYAEGSIRIFANLFDEIRISFIDNYYHIQDRGVQLPWTTLHAPYSLRKQAYDRIKELSDLYKKPLDICGEPGFECTGCVSLDDVRALKIPEDYLTGRTAVQRKWCQCIAEKKELLYRRHPCEHHCLYCYWKD